VLRRLDDFRWKGAGFEAWLFRIAYNLIVDQYRGSGREELVEPAEQADEQDPQDELVRSETASELMEMLNTLSQDQREVLLLRFVAGLETEEIAKIMGRNANAVRQVQFRALDTMRQRMHPEGNDE
jgi:RNA polymerase sigma-70 factor (ECF subfamily)